MAGKAINQYTAFTGNPELVNILVQLKSQSDPNTFEHQKASLADMIKACPDVVMASTYSALPSTGSDGILYVVKDENIIYRWGAELSTPAYVQLTADIITQIIESGDTTHAPSADAVHDALTSEASARQSADSNLKSAIDNNSQRIENLEVAVEGTLVQANTDSTQANTKVITSANEILPWAILKRVGARAVKWNQLSDISSLSVLDGTNYKVEHIDGTVKLTVKTPPSSNLQNFGYPFMHAYLNPAHRYLITGTVAITGEVFSGITALFTKSDDTYSYQAFSDKIVTGYKEILCYTTVTSSNVIGDTCSLVNGQIFDLTINGEYDSTLTDAQNIAKFRAKYPASYYPYNTGEIIPLNPSAFKVVGKQKFDGIMELGDIDASTGADSYNNSLLRTKNYIPISYLEYCLNCSAMSGNNVRARFYDVNKNYIGSSAEGGVVLWNSGFKPMPNACYLRFTMSLGYGTTYNNDVLFCLNSVTDKSYEAYKGTTTDTSFTSDYKYVNENCHDYSENVLVDGVMRREEHKGIVGEVDASQQNWSYSSGTFRLDWSDAAVATDDVALAGYDVCSYLIAAGNIPNMCIKMRDVTSGRFYIRNDNYNLETIEQFKATLGKIYYRKATPPTPTLHDPIPNFPCEDGTTVTAVTPQTDLVNSIDVPSTIAYMTKIGG